LQRDVGAFCEAVKTLGLAVKLDTNGSRPSTLRDLLAAGLVDYVAMDVKAPPRLYAKLAGVDVPWDVIVESIRILATSRIPHLFRTTLVGPLLSEKDIDEIASLLPRGARHVRQGFRADLARDPQLRATAIRETKPFQGVHHVHSS